MTTAARPTLVPAEGGNETMAARPTFLPAEGGNETTAATFNMLSDEDDDDDDDEDDTEDLMAKLELIRKEIEEKLRKEREEQEEVINEVGIIRGNPFHNNRLAFRLKRSDEDDDEDDEDDAEALMAKLELIRKERAEEKLREEREVQEEEIKEVEIIRGNPFLNNGLAFGLKRRWEDDVVFKNQARGEAKAPKRFINDTIRSEFHRKFLQKYMK